MQLPKIQAFQRPVIGRSAGRAGGSGPFQTDRSPADGSGPFQTNLSPVDSSGPFQTSLSPTGGSGPFRANLSPTGGSGPFRANRSPTSGSGSFRANLSHAVSPDISQNARFPFDSQKPSSADLLLVLPHLSLLFQLRHGQHGVEAGVSPVGIPVVQRIRQLPRRLRVIDRIRVQGQQLLTGDLARSLAADFHAHQPGQGNLALLDRAVAGAHQQPVQERTGGRQNGVWDRPVRQRHLGPFFQL